MDQSAVRWPFSAIGAGGGLYVALRALGAMSRSYPLPVGGSVAFAVLMGLAVAGAVLGFLVGPTVLRWLLGILRALEFRLARIPATDLLAGAVGTILGLIIAFLVSPALVHLPLVGRYLPAAVSLLSAYLGWAVFTRKRQDWLVLWEAIGRNSEGHGVETRTLSVVRDARAKVLDTSAIIDGRIIDLYRTGFLEGDLIVAQAVLDELRHIADSPDNLRRQRGRHGLDMLALLQRELRAPVTILQEDPLPEGEVDAKLVLIARERDAYVVTTDYNLNKVAELQGVSVLNVNELANALKPRFLPGEDMIVRVVADGKQNGQGVGYLQDGTMVVVEGGKRFMGEELEIEVTSSIQTSAGRMIFGRPAEGLLDRVGRT